MISPVASAAAPCADLSTATAGPIDTRGATLLVAVVAASSAQTPSDSAGNTWTARGNYITPGGQSVQIWDCLTPVTSASHTLSAGSPGGFQLAAASFMAFSGTDANSFDKVTGASGSSGVTSKQPGAIDPTLDNSLVVAGLVTDVNAAPSVDSGFTGVSANGANSRTVGAGYLVQGSHASVNPTFSWTGSANANATVAAYKPAAVPSPAVMTSYPSRTFGRLAVAAY